MNEPFPVAPVYHRRPARLSRLQWSGTHPAGSSSTANVHLFATRVKPFTIKVNGWLIGTARYRLPTISSHSD